MYKSVGTDAIVAGMALCMVACLYLRISIGSTVVTLWQRHFKDLCANKVQTHPVHQEDMNTNTSPRDSARHMADSRIYIYVKLCNKKQSVTLCIYSRSYTVDILTKKKKKKQANLQFDSGRLQKNRVSVNM